MRDGLREVFSDELQFGRQGEGMRHGERADPASCRRVSSIIPPIFAKSLPRIEEAARTPLRGRRGNMARNVRRWCCGCG